MTDNLICNVCKGEKVIRNRLNNSTKLEICPECKGTGSLVSEYDWKKNRGKKLIKG